MAEMSFTGVVFGNVSKVREIVSVFGLDEKPMEVDIPKNLVNSMRLLLSITH